MRKATLAQEAEGRIATHSELERGTLSLLGRRAKEK